ncbi:MAG: type IV toxin-antitoxin system AbiEi family antitoxin domain-containing protein [Dactylosporangium sp.]|nr:type IV toxin-antitoxin system AbiEi family antitoxin domain-containing protein [Dactylosporangium sp.]NNJ63679.1 type IV toxin-antitoxin system AbiEi family antitoxin domain-containing protein [Dactylosporangium sp.]
MPADRPSAHGPRRETVQEHHLRAELSRIAARQAGIVTRRQAEACGLTVGAIRARLASGRWQRAFPGIYATFNGPVPRDALRWAATLCGGPLALLSHESAAEVWHLRDETTGCLHIRVPLTCQVASRPGLVVHRSARAEQARHPSRLPPLTRVEETVIDLTQTARSIDQAVGWLSGSCERGLTTPSRLLATLGGRGKARWRAELVDGLRDVARGCHSVLERRYLRDVEVPHGLPTAARQTRSVVNGRSRYDDVRYEQWKLVVELDGRMAHPCQTRCDDRWRDNVTLTGGLAVLRYGWGDVIDRPCLVAAQVATMLRHGGWRGSPVACSPACRVEAE